MNSSKPPGSGSNVPGSTGSTNWPAQLPPPGRPTPAQIKKAQQEKAREQRLSSSDGQSSGEWAMPLATRARATEPLPPNINPIAQPGPGLPFAMNAVMPTQIQALATPSSNGTMSRQQALDLVKDLADAANKAQADLFKAVGEEAIQKALEPARQLCEFLVSPEFDHAIDLTSIPAIDLASLKVALSQVQFSSFGRIGLDLKNAAEAKAKIVNDRFKDRVTKPSPAAFASLAREIAIAGNLQLRAALAKEVVLYMGQDAAAELLVAMHEIPGAWEKLISPNDPIANAIKVSISTNMKVATFERISRAHQDVRVSFLNPFINEGVQRSLTAELLGPVVNAACADEPKSLAVSTHIDRLRSVDAEVRKCAENAASLLSLEEAMSECLKAAGGLGTVQLRFAGMQMDRKTGKPVKEENKNELHFAVKRKTKFITHKAEREQARHLKDNLQLLERAVGRALAPSSKHEGKT